MLSNIYPRYMEVSSIDKEIPIHLSTKLVFMGINRLLLFTKLGFNYYKKLPISLLLSTKGGVFNFKAQNRVLKRFLNEYLEILRVFRYPAKRILIFSGLGLRVSYSRRLHSLEFKLGFSHKPLIILDKEIVVSIKKGQLYLQSLNKEKLGSLTYSIKNLRRPDLYQGKGIREKSEKKIIRIFKKK